MGLLWVILHTNFSNPINSITFPSIFSVKTISLPSFTSCIVDNQLWNNNFGFTKKLLPVVIDKSIVSHWTINDNRLFVIHNKKDINHVLKYLFILPTQYETLPFLMSRRMTSRSRMPHDSGNNQKNKSKTTSPHPLCKNQRWKSRRMEWRPIS